jgi:biotin carboxyl carrier protein
MKYNITIDDQTFSVEIEDLRARPIVAMVDGERFEVWPENGNSAPCPDPETKPAPAAARPVTPPPAAAPVAPSSSLAGNVVKAPIPGVVVAVLVKPGQSVKVGQELVTIEAMKMKNAIRATRDGVIAQVHVETGQTVPHSQPLVSFAE